MALKGFIYDLDGVIVDTAKLHFLAWQRLAKSLGIDFSHEENEQLKGVSRVDSLHKILNWGGISLSKADFEASLIQKNEWYLEYVDAMKPDEILPGVREFLQASADAGLKIALGSASKNAEKILVKTQLISFFDALIDGNQVTLSKPNPEVFLKGAAEICLEPNEFVVFEDAQAGVEAALAGGMKVIGIGEPENLVGASQWVSGLDKLNVDNVLKELN
jgi:beta-phosphoglucomutase